MQRQIKFRAWDKMENKYIYSDEFSEENSSQQYVLHNFFAYCYDECDIDFFEEFTGLKDGNGKEIYEGDIVENRDGTWKVEFIENFGAFCMVYEDQIQRLDMCCRSNEVIGNIYENKELLEVKK